MSRRVDSKALSREVKHAKGFPFIERSLPPGDSHTGGHPTVLH
jgi:hypothetical protein